MCPLTVPLVSVLFAGPVGGAANLPGTSKFYPMTFPLITTRLSIAPLGEQDAAEFVAYRRDPDVARWQGSSATGDIVKKYGCRELPGKCSHRARPAQFTRRKLVADEAKQIPFETIAGQLMARVANGEEAPFAELFDVCNPLILTSIREFIACLVLVELIAEQVFVALWRSAPYFHPRRCDVRSWIMNFVLFHTVHVQQDRVA